MLNKKIMDRGEKLFDFIYLNFLWLLGTIPLLTIGASNTALTCVIGKIVRKEDYNVTKDFLKSYRENLIQGSFLGIFFNATICFGLYLIRQVHFYGLSKIWMIIIGLLILELILIQAYLYPFLSRYYMKTLNLLFISTYVANRYLGRTVLSLVGLSTIFYISVYVPVLFILISFSLASFVNYKVIVHLIESDWDDILSRN